MHLWAEVLLAILCAAASALFSGLILGYMSLDVLQLQLLTYVDAKSPQERLDSRRARRILPLRRDPNLLLSTLIFSNAMVNALMILLLGDMLDMTWGFIVSTLTTAIFGEIAPQSIFMRYALPLCGLFAQPLRVLVFLLYPISKPLSLLLDYLMGPYSQVVYNRQQLKALVDLQLEKGNVLTLDEAKMLKGCLEMSSITAESIMTPLDTVYAIEEGTTVTKDVVNAIAKSGFNNIPIVSGDNHKSVVGFIAVKDLLMLNTSKGYKVGDLFQSIGKPTYAVDADSVLNDVLSCFKGVDSTHVVVVRKAFVEPNSDADPIYKHVGIITIGDIIEVVIQDTIRGESERGLEGNELIAKRMETQVEKFKRLGSVATVHTFSLNSIRNVFPLQDPNLVLKALDLPSCPENMDILNSIRVYLLKKNTLIPSGGTWVLLRGHIGYVDEMTEIAVTLPCAINSREMGRSMITLSDCEVIEVEMIEDFKR